MTLIHRCNRCGGGDESGIRYRLDQPEIIKRALSFNGTTGGAAAAWTFGAWTQHMSAAEFGASPLWLRGLIATPSLTLFTNVNVTTIINRQFVYELGTGLVAAPPTPIERVHAIINAFVSVGGIAADPVTASITATESERLHISPRLVAASTPIAMRSAKSDGGTAIAGGFYTVWYPDPLYDFAVLPFDKLEAASVVPDLADWTCTTGAGTFVFGSYADIFPGPSFQSTADYLVDSVTHHHEVVTPSAEVQFDFARGDPGAEVVQARSAFCRAAATAQGGRNEFPEPWRINTGDRIRVRGAGRSAGFDCFGTLQLRAILP